MTVELDTESLVESAFLPSLSCSFSLRFWSITTRNDWAEGALGDLPLEESSMKESWENLLLGLDLVLKNTSNG